MTEKDYKDIEELIKNQKYKEALTRIENCLNKENDNISLLEKCGDSYFGLKNYEMAMNYHSKAFNLNKENQLIKSKLLNDIHYKENLDNDVKNKKYKDKKTLDDYKPMWNDFLHKKLF